MISEVEIEHTEHSLRSSYWQFKRNRQKSTLKVAI